MDLSHIPEPPEDYKLDYTQAGPDYIKGYLAEPLEAVGSLEEEEEASSVDSPSPIGGEVWIVGIGTIAPNVDKDYPFTYLAGNESVASPLTCLTLVLQNAGVSHSGSSHSASVEHHPTGSGHQLETSSASVNTDDSTEPEPTPRPKASTKHSSQEFYNPNNRSHKRQRNGVPEYTLSDHFELHSGGSFTLEEHIDITVDPDEHSLVDLADSISLFSVKQETSECLY